MKARGSTPIKAARLLSGAALLALSGSLAGCYKGTGDFGRPGHGIVETRLLPFAGLLSATAQGEPASIYALTEDEKELRRRAWHFLVPEQDAPLLARLQDEMAFYRLLPAREPDITLYHRTIMGGPQLGATIGSSPILRAATGGDGFASLTSRYNRVKDNISIDHQLVPSFKLVAAQVREADHLRAMSFAAVQNLSEEQRSQAQQRICENALITARVTWAFHDRAAQYRYALEHLLVEGPEREAIPAERSLMAFEADIGRFQKDITSARNCETPVDLPPRLEARPLVRKG